MSTRKSAKPRKSGKTPKFTEIDGHRLTPELYREYERHLESRQRTNRDRPSEYVKYLALDDTICRYRFSGSTKEKLGSVYRQLAAVASAVAALGLHYPFYEDTWRVRLTGCDALNRLAAEAQLLGAKIHAIGDAIRHEKGEHLQDWLKRQAAFDASSAYGRPPTAHPDA